MEIIHTYMSDETEICVISDNISIHLADKSDLAIESPKVGSVLKPSQMNEVYLEMPIEVLQEVARRSGVFVEPDVDEEGEEETSEDGSEEEDEGLAPWEPLAREQFFEEYKALAEGVDVRILINFPVKVRWEEGTEALWDTSDGAYTLEEALDRQDGLTAAMATFNGRIATMQAAMARFTQDQIDLGHDMSEHSVDQYLTNEWEAFEAEDVASAAE